MAKQSKTPIAFSLPLSITLNYRDLKLTAELVLELPRHELARDRELLRRFLERPMRANKMPEGPDREKWIKGEHDARIKAMFAYYSVPDILDERDQWQWLAMCLAGEVFAGCKTIRVGQGGAPPDPFAEHAKMVLHRLFEEYKNRNPRLSDAAIAKHLLDNHRAECEAAKLRARRSLAQAMRRITQGKNTGIQTPA